MVVCAMWLINGEGMNAMKNNYNDMPNVARVGCLAKRQTAADEVLDFANRLANNIEGLADRVGSRLSPISRCSPPSTGNAGDCCESMPAYFEQVRGALFRIERHMDSINDSLERVEL